MYFIGIDGGGTKTKFTLVNKNLEIIKEIIKGTCHYNQIGFENVEKLLLDGVNEIILSSNIDKNEVKYIFAGLCGYGKIKDIVDRLDKVAKKAFSGFNYSVGSDIEIALAGSLNLDEGINVISGTGSIALALDKDNNLYRCGGFGYRLGDEGSAYWIGCKTLNIFTKQVDGRCERSSIYDIIKEEVRISSDYDIIKYVNEEINGDRGEIAKFSKLCFKAATQGDKYAIKIFEEAAIELSELIKVLGVNFEKNKLINVSYTGGVFKCGDLILKPLRNNLDKERFNLIDPVYDPDMGACLLAKQLYEKEKEGMNELYIKNK